ncbi:MAG: fused MFS/spermidine synthase, partial [Pseudomonadota bacterium]
SSMPVPLQSAAIKKLVIAAYGLNGFIAISYEIVWSRIFQVQVGTSLYAFSLMLAWYLAGIAAGSLCGARYIHRIQAPLRFFGLAQLGIAVYSVVGMYIFLLFQPVSITAILNLGNVLIMPLVIVFPVTFLLGLIFPVVSKMYVANESEVGRGVGLIYSVNTFGCIIGSFVCGFILIGSLGTKGTIVVLSGLNILIGLTLISIPAGEKKNKKTLALSSLAAGAALALGIFLPDPFLTTVKKAIDLVWGKDAYAVDLYYNKESLAATTTAFGLQNKPLSKQLWINGVGMTKLCTQTKIMAHLPILLHADPKNILVVCFGMGTTLRSAWAHKALHCDAVELVPEIFDCFQYFHQNARTIESDSRVQRYADDGRNFLMMRSKKYDVITMDPPPPLWSAGAVNLYTKEFFALCKEHLQANGVMCVWLPPLEFSECIMVIKTFHTVFPNTYVWGGPSRTDGEFLIGLPDAAELDVRRFFVPPADPDILADLNEWDAFFPTLDALLKLLILSPAQVSILDKGVPVITDDTPYTEFPLWRSLFDPAHKLVLTARQLAAWRDATFRRQ